ncbi:MAG: alanine--tRNA ligase-related protein, partial [Patescibacteria group bacterium]
MTSQEIRKRFLEFFKARGHAVVPSASLIPDDPSVLLTTAGMQQFKPYFTGEKDPVKDFGSKNTVSIQKSFRTSDIDEVGDESHLTFFEMLGNFSFGGYFKREAIELAYEFLISNFQFPISNLSATVFGGDGEVPRDNESVAIWSKLGFSESRGNLRFSGRGDNFWGPTGAEGPCGPTTEIYINGVETWNLVFNEYYCKTRTGADPSTTLGASSARTNAEKILEPLSIKGVDTGMGLERLAVAVQNKNNIFETDLFAPLIEPIPSNVPEKQKRIIADHVRASVFLLADGVRPSNKDRGYILRRLMRRTLVYEYIYKIPPAVFETIIENIVANYGEFYPELAASRESIRQEVGQEWERFGQTLERGLKELDRVNQMDAKTAFDLYQSYGLPYE